MRRCAVVLLLLFTCGAAMGAEIAADKPALLVYGQGFIFGVHEPKGWKADTGRGAAESHTNVVFFPPRGESRNADVTIRVRVNRKVDENTAADLAYDMDGTRHAYLEMQFRDFAADHPTYAAFPKLFVYPNQTYEYVVYLNPGPPAKWTFSVVMTTHHREATQAELETFRAVTRSVVLLKSAKASK